MLRDGTVVGGGFEVGVWMELSPEASLLVLLEFLGDERGLNSKDWARVCGCWSSSVVSMTLMLAQKEKYCEETEYTIDRNNSVHMQKIELHWQANVFLTWHRYGL